MKKIYALVLLITIICTSTTIFICCTLYQNPTALNGKRLIFFRVDSSFSKEYLVAIDNAMLRWEVASGGLVSMSWYTEKIHFTEAFSWLSDGVPTIYNASSFGWKWFITKVHYSVAVLGISFWETGDIFIVDNNTQRFEVLTTHEIGHVLLGDAPHSNNMNSVMFSSFGRNYKHQKILDKDVSLLKKSIGVK